MTDDNRPQKPLADESIAALRSWSNVGAPGPAPTTPFVPSDDQKRDFRPIESPRTINVQWVLDQEAYKRLRLGHLAREMEDKWNVYMEDDTVHFHRSWTGMEVFRFTVEPALSSALSSDQKPSEQYRIGSFEVEQNPERYTETDEQAIKATLSEVLQAVIGIGVSATS